MKFKKTIITAAIMAAPLLAYASENNMGMEMQVPVADTQTASDSNMMRGGPMMGSGYRQGMMGQGKHEGCDMMEMMGRQQMMERRMDMMEMRMNRQRGMQGGRGGPMMDGSRGGMPGMMGPGMQGQGMGMQGGPMMDNRMGDMRGMNMEQRQQMMKQRMEMMQNHMQQMRDQGMGMPGVQGGNQDALK